MGDGGIINGTPTPNAIQIRREGPFCEKIGEELSIQSSHEKGPSDVF
jgi:hypothetical protein